MAAITQPDPVKLICGMISARAELFDLAQARLEETHGPADVCSEIIPFDFTNYYDEEMGCPRLRKFVAFTKLIDPGQLAEIKRATNLLEDQFAETCGTVAPGCEKTPQKPPTTAEGDCATFCEKQKKVRRPINLDPGYVAPSRLILASMKDFSHRIYLQGGVFGEVTLQYRNGWQSLDWTFPDYASGRYHPFLDEVRAKLRSQQTQEKLS